MTDFENDEIYFIPLTGEIGPEVLEDQDGTDIILNFAENIDADDCEQDHTRYGQDMPYTAECDALKFEQGTSTDESTIWYTELIL